MVMTAREMAEIAQNVPAYAQLVNDQFAEQRKQAALTAQYRKDADWYAQNKGQELGRPESIGNLGPNTGIPQQDGTGFYSEGVAPMRRFMAERAYNKRLSGLENVSKQGDTSSQGIESSINSGVNQLDLERWKKSNIPQKADTNLEQLMQYKQRLAESGQDTTAVDAAINKETTRAKGIQLQSDGQGGFSFSQGDVSGTDALGLSSTGKNKANDNIMNGAKQLNQLYRIGRDYQDNYMGFGADVKSVVGSFNDYMFGSGAYAEFNANRGAFRRNIKQLFNDYKVEITGAAASDTEMEDLRDSILNEELGANEFKAAYDQFMEYATTNMITNMKAKNIPEQQIFQQLGFTMQEDSSGKLRVRMPNGDWIEVKQ